MLKLRKPVAGDPLIVTMTAVRMADRLLVIGCSDPHVVATLALKPGITGRACAVDETAERTARAADTAQKEGALLEVETAAVTSLPYAANSFDVAVVSHLLPQLDAPRRIAVLSEAFRVLRTGGRCVILQSARRSGLAGMFSAGQMPASEIESAMQAAGFRAVRTIAEREGLVFAEGARR